MRIFFPQIIPKRKSWLLIIALFFSAALFMASSSVFYAIGSINSDLYGSDPNILVVSNQEAATPFTSNVAPSLEVSLKQIPGVESVSPEIIVPIIYKSNTLIVRGVDWVNYSNVSKVRILSGNFTSLSSSSAVIVSEGLMRRFSFDMNQILELRSALVNIDKHGSIQGVFIDDTIQNEEILVNLEFARELTTFSAGYTHYRVKFDPKITSKDIIRTLITQEFQVGFTLKINNGTEYSKNWNLQIFDFFDNEIFEQDINTVSTQVKLPFGAYRIVAGAQNQLREFEINVFQDELFELLLGKIAYNATIRTTVNSEPRDLLVEIFDLFEPNIYGTYPLIHRAYSTNGTMKDVLTEGEYIIRAWFGMDFTEEIIFLDKISEITLNFLYNPSEIGVSNFVNNSILPDNSGYFQIENLLAEQVQMRINGSIIDPVDEFYFFNLEDGVYFLELLPVNSNSMVNYTFSINSSLNFLQPKSSSVPIIVNGTEIKFDMYGMIPNSINVTLVNTINQTLTFLNSSFSYQTNELTVDIPELSGEYELIINGSSIFLDQFSFSYQLNISNESVLIQSNYHPDTHISLHTSKLDQLDISSFEFSELKFTFINVNYNVSEQFTFLVNISRPYSNNLILRSSLNQTVILKNGAHNITLTIPSFLSYNNYLEIFSNRTVILDLPTVVGQLKIKFNNIDNFEIEEVIGFHEYTGLIINLQYFEDFWIGEDIPIGEVEIQYRFNEQVLVNKINFEEPGITYWLKAPISGNYELDYGKWLGSRSSLQIQQSDSLLANASGPLGFTNVLVIIEAILIFVVLIVSTSGSFIGYMYQSRKEIMILRSMGFSKIQVISSMLRFTFLLNLAVNIIGGAFGLFISRLLFLNNSTIVFGLVFYPVAHPILWISNFIITTSLVIIGGIMGLNYVLLFHFKEEDHN